MKIIFSNVFHSRKLQNFLIVNFCVLFCLNAHAVNCNGVPSWNAKTTYNSGVQVQQNNKAYSAQYTSRGSSPKNNAGSGKAWTLLGVCGGASTPVSGSDCGSAWYRSALTNYESYPAPGSDECTIFNGCTWAGQFYGLSETKSESWVMANNIVSVHIKDWSWLGMKTINLRQGNKRITAKVYDACDDSDCNGCCSQNLGGDGFLIDIEKYTMQRFGSGSGTVEFQVCN